MVVKDTRNATATVSIFPQPELIPSVTISSIVNQLNRDPGTKLLVSASVPDDYPNPVQWTWTNPSNNLDLGNRQITPWTNDSTFIIAPNGMSAGVTYVFTVTALDTKAGKSSASNVTITTIYPPRNGNCQSSPRNGSAFNTSFYISCVDWVDDPSRYPLSYRFWLIPLDESPPVTPLRDFDPLNGVTLQLPAGNRTILAEIKDMANATTQFFFSIIVEHTELTTTSQGVNTIAGSLIGGLGNALSVGDVDLIGQTLAVVADALGSMKSTGADELNQRIAYREQMLGSVVSLGESTVASVYNMRRQIELVSQVCQTLEELSSSTRVAALSQAASLASTLISNPSGEDTSQIASNFFQTLANVGASMTADEGSNGTLESKDYALKFEDHINLISAGLLAGNVPGESTNIQSGDISLSAVRSRPGQQSDDTNLQVPSLKLQSQFIDVLMTTSGNVFSALNSQLSKGTTPSPTAKDAPTTSSKVVTVTIKDESGNVVPVKDTGKVSSTEESALLSKEESNLIRIVIPHDPIPWGLERNCSYFDYNTSTWKGDGCRVQYTQSTLNLTVCYCNHLTSFSITFGSFVPHVNTIDLADIYALTPANVARNPSTLIGLMIFVGIYVLFIGIAIRRDRREANENVKQEILDSWKSKHVGGSTLTSRVLHRIKRDHLWLGLYYRNFGDDFKSADRLTTFITLLIVNMAVSAMYFGQSSNGAILVASIMSSMTLIPISMLVTHLFTLSGDMSLRRQFEYQRKVDLAISFPNEYRTPNKPFRLPGWCRYFNYILCFCLCFGSGFLAIVYGIRFDVIRQRDAELGWQFNSQEFFNGPLISESYDKVETCQLSCLNNTVCNGVIVRFPDLRCFQVGPGSLAPISDPSLRYDSYLVKVLSQTTSQKWVISSVSAAVIDIFTDMIKITILTCIIWQCQKERIYRKKGHVLEMIRSRSPTAESGGEEFRYRPALSISQSFQSGLINAGGKIRSVSMDINEPQLEEEEEALVNDAPYPLERAEGGASPLGGDGSSEDRGELLETSGSEHAPENVETAGEEDLFILGTADPPAPPTSVSLPSSPSFSASTLSKKANVPAPRLSLRTTQEKKMHHHAKSVGHIALAQKSPTNHTLMEIQADRLRRKHTSREAEGSSSTISHISPPTPPSRSRKIGPKSHRSTPSTPVTFSYPLELLEEHEPTQEEEDPPSRPIHKDEGGEKGKEGGEDGEKEELFIM